MAGVRCSTGLNADEVRDGRSHDDINVLAISADYTPSDKAKEMIVAFLQTDFSGQERHLRQIDKIRKREYAR